MNEQDVTLIERYLANELNEQETRNLEERLNQDTSFKDLFDWMNALKQALLAERGKEVSRKLKDIAEKYNRAAIPAASIANQVRPADNLVPIWRRRSVRIGLAIAATLALLLVVVPPSMFKNNVSQFTNSREYVMKYLDSYPDSVRQLEKNIFARILVIEENSHSMFDDSLDQINFSKEPDKNAATVEVFILQGTQYNDSYFYDLRRRELYLFGDFGSDFLLYKESDNGTSDTLILVDKERNRTYKVSPSSEIVQLISQE